MSGFLRDASAMKKSRVALERSFFLILEGTQGRWVQTSRDQESDFDKEEGKQ